MIVIDLGVMPKNCKECDLCIDVLDTDGDINEHCALDMAYGWLPNPKEKRLKDCRIQIVNILEES
jgi:hypothetical protein